MIRVMIRYDMTKKMQWQRQIQRQRQWQTQIHLENTFNKGWYQRLVTFETYEQSDEETSADQQKDNYSDNDKDKYKYTDNDRDMTWRVNLHEIFTFQTVETLNSWQSSLWPDNLEWHWTAFAILAMFYLYTSKDAVYIIVIL